MGHGGKESATRAHHMSVNRMQREKAQVKTEVGVTSKACPQWPTKPHATEVLQFPQTVPLPFDPALPGTFLDKRPPLTPCKRTNQNHHKVSPIPLHFTHWKVSWDLPAQNLTLPHTLGLMGFSEKLQCKAQIPVLIQRASKMSPCGQCQVLLYLKKYLGIRPWLLHPSTIREYIHALQVAPFEHQALEVHLCVQAPLSFQILLSSLVKGRILSMELALWHAGAFYGEGLSTEP